MTEKTFKSLLQSRRVVSGLWLRSENTDFVEITGLAGFDFLYLDREHTTTDWQTLKKLTLAAEVVDLPVLLRVEKNDSVLIRKALEIGIQGILVPFVSTKEEGVRAVRAARFPPQGTRGMDRGVRSSRFSVPNYSEYMIRSNTEKTIGFMVENREAVENIDDILSIEGLDFVCFGPSDYSISIGTPGDYANPKVRMAEEKVITKAKAKGVHLLRTVSTLEDMRRYIEKGVRLFVVGSDMEIFQKGCREIMDNIVKKAKIRA